MRSGKHRFYSATAGSLVDHTGLDDPLKAVTHLCNGLLDEVGVAEPPVPLDVLASFRGAIEVKANDIRESGRLTPLKQGGFLIEVRATDPVGRRNFSIGHEIGHLLMPNYQISPTQKVDVCTGEFSLQNEEEFLCDSAATNLLLPEELFRSQCSRVKPSLDGFIGLADLFQASLEATALRLDRLAVWDCIPVVWQLGFKPSQMQPCEQMGLFDPGEVPGPKEEFRVKFDAGRKDLFFAEFRHIPMQSDMVSTCMAGDTYRGRCIVPASPKQIECYVEARSIHYRNEKGEEKQRLVSLVFPSQ